MAHYESEKKLIKKLRVLELRKFLKFGHVDCNGLKPVLINKAMRLFDHFQINGRRAEMMKILQELVSRLKTPLRLLRADERSLNESFRAENVALNEIRVQLHDVFADSHCSNSQIHHNNSTIFPIANGALQNKKAVSANPSKDFGSINVQQLPEQSFILEDSPFFESLECILPQTEMKPENSDYDCFQFVLNERHIAEILFGRQRDGVYLIEVQLRFFYDNLVQRNCSPHLRKLDVNGSSLAVQEVGCPIYYITHLCIFHSAKPNRILVSWNHFDGEGFSATVNLVKRTSIRKLASLKPIPQNYDVTCLIKEEIKKTEKRCFNLSFMCQLTKNRMLIPCQSNKCENLHFFDLDAILRSLEKCIYQVCPVCQRDITFDSLIINTEFRQLIKESNEVNEIQFATKKGTQNDIADFLNEAHIITID